MGHERANLLARRFVSSRSRPRSTSSVRSRPGDRSSATGAFDVEGPTLRDHALTIARIEIGGIQHLVAGLYGG